MLLPLCQSKSYKHTAITPMAPCPPGSPCPYFQNMIIPNPVPQTAGGPVPFWVFLTPRRLQLPPSSALGWKHVSAACCCLPALLCACVQPLPGLPHPQSPTNLRLYAPQTSPRVWGKESVQNLASSTIRVNVSLTVQNVPGPAPLLWLPSCSRAPLY